MYPVTTATKLPFSRDSVAFHAFQDLWRNELGEELTYEKAGEYGPKILALIGAMARAKRMR